MRAIFIRHGESTGNAGVPCHDLATIALTERGHEQARAVAASWRSEEHTSALQSLMRISDAVFCVNKHTAERQPTDLATHDPPGRDAVRTTNRQTTTLNHLPQIPQ